MIQASSGPALPKIAEKATTLAKAALKASSKVLPKKPPVKEVKVK